MSYITSERQKAVLVLRLELLARGADAQKVERDMLAKLRDPKISPEKLAPVLVRRNHESHYAAAYLLERISDTGYRLLVTDKDRWHIVRAKATSHVVVLAPHHEKAHYDLVLKQSQLRFDVSRLLKDSNGCRTLRSKGSRNRKSARRTSRSSSRAKK